MVALVSNYYGLLRSDSLGHFGLNRNLFQSNSLGLTVLTLRLLRNDLTFPLTRLAWLDHLLHHPWTYRDNLNDLPLAFAAPTLLNVGTSFSVTSLAEPIPLNRHLDGVTRIRLLQSKL